MLKQAGIIKVRVSCVSYLNAIPFIYGLDNSAFSNLFSLRVMPPSKCFTSFIKHETDIALVPSAALAEIQKPHVILPFCIASDNQIGSVFLLSNQPIENISTIYLDIHSITSNKLLQILCHHYWKISPIIRFPNSYPPELNTYEALVAIGDKSFKMLDNFKFHYDLAAEWKKFTNLPFVFAIWLTHLTNEIQILKAFNEALQFSVNNIPESIEYCQPSIMTVDKIYNYLTNNIIYKLNDHLLKGMFKFLSFLDTDAEHRIDFIKP